MQIAGHRLTISGTVCMNQFVIDVGDEKIGPGAEIVLFGPGDNGEPTAQDWADALGTLSYEIVTRFGGKLPRSYCGVTQGGDPALVADGRTDGQVAAAY